jgi:hypothetical protein
MYPLAVNYDADIHDALVSLRILDGTIPRHAKHGAPVIFLAPARTIKFFVKPNTPMLGGVHYIIYLHLSIILIVSFRKVFPVSCFG